jgi:hypothetical protein
MYFTFAIVQAFPRFMPAEGARVASDWPRRVRGDIPRYAAARVTRPVKPTTYGQFAALTIYKLNFLNVG